MLSNTIDFLGFFLRLYLAMWIPFGVLIGLPLVLGSALDRLVMAGG